MPISRREFLRSGGSLLAAAALGPVLVRFPRRARERTRVLVMGAGAAGLSAAYELDRAGYEVLVLEAKMIPGGRIHTVRAPFADGLYAEAGATFLGDAHNLTMHYLREFNLPLAPIQPRDFIPSLFHVAGHRVESRLGEPMEWPVSLNADERGMSFFELQRRYRYSPFSALGLDPEDWPHAAHFEYDRKSLADYWRELGASEGAIRVLSLGYLRGVGEGPESLSTLGMMHDYGANSGGQNIYRVEGGNDLLPRAFASRLGSKIRYGAPVVAVRQDAAGVEVTVDDATGQHQVSGDYVICTAPFAVLRHVEFHPGLSELRRRAMQEIESTSLTRIYLQCRERFWQTDGNGAAWTDLPVMSVGHATIGQPGVRGILESMSAGANARRFAVMSHDDRIELAAQEIAKVHPDLPEYLEGGHSVCWDNDPWALGDYAYFKPGQIEEFFPQIQEPEGRVYFAGDHIGGQPGYVQSAFLSGQAAAAGIGARE